jgi:phosphatidylglycerophosphate synthase
VLAAESFGKHKTISQIVAILAVLVFRSYGQWGAFGRTLFGFPAGRPWIEWLAILSLDVAVILTFTSGAIYLWRNRSLYLADL